MPGVPLFDAKGFDAIVPAWVAKLELWLPTAIDRVNGEVTDGWLVEPPEVLDYAPPISTVTFFPTVGIVTESESREDDVGREWTGVYHVGFAVFVQCSDPEGFGRLARRTARAVQAAVLADRRLVVEDTPAMTTGRLESRGIAWGPAFADVPSGEGPPSAYMTWALVRVTSRHDESAFA